jgi:uncharacterized protein YqgC (DUF456 family)
METTVIILLALLTIALVAAGIVFCIVPPLPGPVVGYLALVSYEFMPDVEGFSVWTYLGWAVVVLVVTVADFIFPPAVTRKFGGTAGAVWGGAIGAIVGLFFAPFGIVLGPLIGAIAGDLLAGNRFRSALKSGFGSFVGFILGTGAKVAVCVGIGIVIAVTGALDIWGMFRS